MEIKQTTQDQQTILWLQGRLDSSWARVLDEHLEEALRAGSYQLVLDFSEVDYISSAALRSLLKYRRKLAAVGGGLAIRQPTEAVVEVIRLTGLEDLFQPMQPSTKSVSTTQTTPNRTVWQRSEGTYEVISTAPHITPTPLRIIGTPGKVDKTGYDDSDCHAPQLAGNEYGLGLGALGSGWNDCCHRFGEVLLTGTAVTYQPTGGSQDPDYLVSSQPGGQFPLQMLYGMSFLGEFGWQIRMTATDKIEGVGFAELVESVLAELELTFAGIVVVGESAGISGLALRRSPIHEQQVTEQHIFTTESFHHWTRFSVEREMIGQSVLAVTIAGYPNNMPTLAPPYLRSLDTSEGMMQHTHGAIFSFRPWPQESVELEREVRLLYDEEELQGVWHLLDGTKIRQHQLGSGLTRAVLWVVPLEGVTDWQTVSERDDQ